MFSQLQVQHQICSLLTVILLAAALKAKVEARTSLPIAKKGCNDTCGNVSIPFPFGIGPDCFKDDWYEIDCRASSVSKGSSKPFLSKFNNVEVMNITYIENRYDYREKQSVIIGVPPMNVCAADAQLNATSIDLRDSPYNFSAYDNVFVVKGCPGSAVLLNQSRGFMAGCASVCLNKQSMISTKSCYGVECCQTPLPSGYSYQNSLLGFYQIEFNFDSGADHQNCLLATLIESGSVDKYFGKLSASISSSSLIPVVLRWRWMSNRKPDNTPRATCDSTSVASGLSCTCKWNHYGNPYLADGCQAPESCKSCPETCYKLGENKFGCPFPFSPVIYGFMFGLGVLIFVIGCYGLSRFIKRRRELKRRAKFFKHNGGLLLQQRLSSNDGFVERTRIFKVNELDQATDHFNENRILGQGGQGTVYKGMLTDGKIVAVKKSKLPDQSQLEQFINELVILSQINHRNVVNLLGCCLETEVPLLVYEFISNGDLSDHLHNPDEDFVFSWEMRLKIATDSAGAIAYLHSSSAMPIYHRDIKSSNILLDKKNIAKVADFGISRTVAIDQTHLTTIVQGTFGYLDPDYVLTRKFSEKSDVYSFGVVLLELLTGKEAIYKDGPIYKNLATEFQYLISNSRLSEILDPEIVRDANEDELMIVAQLARRCLRWNGEMRPTMKEVAMTLEMVISSPDQASALNQQAHADGSIGEYSMTETSNTEFTAITLPAGGSSPVYTDVKPLLLNTL